MAAEVRTRAVAGLGCKQQKMRTGLLRKQCPRSGTAALKATAQQQVLLAFPTWVATVRARAGAGRD